MNYREHTICGLGFFAIVNICLDQFPMFPTLYSDSFILLKYLFFTVWGSLIPDFDHPNAHYTKVISNTLITISGIGLCIYYFISMTDIIQNNIEKTGYQFFLIILGIGIFIKLFSWIIYKFFGHRGILHTPLLYTLISVVFLLLSLVLNIDRVSVLFFLGGVVFGHIIPDSLTNRGIMFFYPFNKKYYNCAPVRALPVFKFFVLVFIITIVSSC